MILTRTESSEQGTFGTIGKWFTVELPWKDNQRRISCIPAGTYLCKWHKSPSKGWVYQIMNVPNRDDILIHVGNWGGDVSRGFKSDVLGCIAMGTSITTIKNQKAVGNSINAIKQFFDAMKKQDFELTIVDAFK